MHGCTWLARWEGQLRVVCLLVWVFAVALAVLWNSLAWALFPPSDWSPLPGGETTSSYYILLDCLLILLDCLLI